MTQTDASLKVWNWQILSIFDFTTLSIEGSNTWSSWSSSLRYNALYCSIVSTKVNMSKIRCGERNFCFPPNFFIFILADNVFCRFDCWILDFSTLTFITFLKEKERKCYINENVKFTLFYIAMIFPFLNQSRLKRMCLKLPLKLIFICANSASNLNFCLKKVRFF